MKGLLLKDFYIIRSILALLGVVFIVIGACFTYLINPWVLTVLATVMLGMNVVSTINIDKSSGWLKTVMTTPVTRKTFITSKYTLYLLLSIAGLIFGIAFGFIGNTLLDGDTKMLGMFICISLTMALLSGSVILPVQLIFDENKGMIGMLLSYPISAGFLVFFILLCGNTISSLILVVLIAICLFLVSWYLSTKILTQKDL